MLITISSYHGFRSLGKPGYTAVAANVKSIYFMSQAILSTESNHHMMDSICCVAKASKLRRVRSPVSQHMPHMLSHQHDQGKHLAQPILKFYVIIGAGRALGAPPSVPDGWKACGYSLESLKPPLARTAVCA